MTELVPTSASAVTGRRSALSIDAATARYAQRALADNTVRGYRSDWSEYNAWCQAHGIDPLPPDTAAVARYIASLAQHGAKVGTISRRLSAMRHAFTRAGHPPPLDDPFVAAVWSGILNEHGAPPEQSAALTPPLLWDVVNAAPTVNDDGSPNLTGLRDRAVILVGWWAALRRSELVGIDIKHLTMTQHGYTLTVPRSKTNQTGIEPERKALPRKSPGRCPVEAIDAWRTAARIETGPLLRGVTRYNTVRSTRLHAATIDNILTRLLTTAGADPAPFSPHSLRAGFVTTVRLAGIADTAITHQTDQHAVTLAHYTRIADLWTNNAAVMFDA